MKLNLLRWTITLALTIRPRGKKEPPASVDDLRLKLKNLSWKINRIKDNLNHYQNKSEQPSYSYISTQQAEIKRLLEEYNKTKTALSIAAIDEISSLSSWIGTYKLSIKATQEELEKFNPHPKTRELENHIRRMEDNIQKSETRIKLLQNL